MVEKNPDHTPAAWARECLGLLKSIHPDYRRNRYASGRFIEFVRPDPSGLLISQNFLRTRDTYWLCVALLFSERCPARLDHPLFAGSRFDNGRNVGRQFLDDFGLGCGDSGCPSGAWSFGPWRSNTLENLARGFAVNEEHLIPRYREALHAGKSRLIRIFEAARKIVPALDPKLPIPAQAACFGVAPDAVRSYPLGAARVEAFTLARGGSCYLGFGPRTDTVDLDSIPPEVMVLHFADCFLLESERLDEMVSISKAL